MSAPRELTDREIAAVQLLTMVEEFANLGLPTAKVMFHREAYNEAVTGNALETLRTEVQTDGSIVVTLTLLGYMKYVDFICGRLGLDVAVNGTVTTRDGLILNIPEPPNRSSNKGSAA